MKKTFVLFLMLSFLLSGCWGRSRMRICRINNIESFENGRLKESLFVEKDNHRFVWSRAIDENRYCEFRFKLSVKETNKVYSDEFDFFDSENKEIRFKERDGGKDKFYDFYGSMTVYIDYKNILNEIESVIENDDYSIDAASNTWVTDKSLGIEHV